MSRLLQPTDLHQRAADGPQVSKSEWDFEHVALTTREVVEEFALAWVRGSPLLLDPAMADRLFAAGVELAARLGIYLPPTHQVARFSRDELESGLRETSRKLVFGSGKDAVGLTARQVEDPNPPRVWAGPPGTPVPEEIFLPLTLSYLQEAQVDLLTCGSLIRVGGQDVRTGEETEIEATQRELDLLHQALRRAGRAGMGLLAAQSSLTERGDAAVIQSGALRHGDAHLVPFLNELVLDSQNLARVENAAGHGIRNASLACVMVGGLGGGAPGAAALQVASLMLANLACQADYHLLHPIHIRHVATTTPEVLWVQSAVAQAFARNAPCVIVGDVYPKSGALTRELLYETAANTLVLTASGAHLEGVAGADGALPHCSGLEVRWMAQVAGSATAQRCPLSEVDRLVRLLYTRYEHVFRQTSGNPGVPFDQAYDLDTLQPVPAWQALYDEVCEEVRQLGLQV